MKNSAAIWLLCMPTNTTWMNLPQWKRYAMPQNSTWELEVQSENLLLLRSAIWNRSIRIYHSQSCSLKQRQMLLAVHMRLLLSLMLRNSSHLRSLQRSERLQQMFAPAFSVSRSDTLPEIVQIAIEPICPVRDPSRNLRSITLRLHCSRCQWCNIPSESDFPPFCLNCAQSGHELLHCDQSTVPEEQVQAAWEVHFQTTSNSLTPVSSSSPPEVRNNIISISPGEDGSVCQSRLRAV